MARVVASAVGAAAVKSGGVSAVASAEGTGIAFR